jgi:hypothetical protein
LVINPACLSFEHQGTGNAGSKRVPASPSEFIDEQAVDAMTSRAPGLNCIGPGARRRHNKNAAFPKEGGVLFDRDT